MSIDKLGLNGEFKHLDSTPPSSSKAVSSMTMEAVVENKPQELRVVKPFNVACLSIPGNLPGAAQITLQCFFSCFEQQKNVKEGLIGDILWGFEQAGIPIQCSIDGLRELHRLGYLKFQAKDNEFVSFDSDKIQSAFIRYEKKLLDMVYENPTSV